MNAQFISLIDLVIPPDRQRKTYNEQRLDELADSIERNGLLHAIVLRNDRKTLAAGFRRSKAIEKLKGKGVAIRHNGNEVPLGHIPYVTVDQLDAIALKEVELEENLCREDLTWQDRVRAINELRELRLAQNPATTNKAIAEEIIGRDLPNEGAPVVEVSDSALVAQYLDDPEVAKAGSLKEARKIVSRKLEREFREALAKYISTSAFESPHRVILGDCTEAIKTLPSDHFSCVVTDPPYGIDADQFGSQSIIGHEYKDNVELFWATQTALAPELFRVMKPDSHLYMFCDIELFPKLKIIYSHHGFDVWRTPLFWNKSPHGMLPDPEGGPRRCYETILLARKGRRLMTAVYGDVLTYPVDANKEHAAQKPVDVYIDLLRRSCIPGEEVLDCFCGRGTIFLAANKLRLRATGIEKDPAQYTIAAAKLQGATNVTAHSEKAE